MKYNDRFDSQIIDAVLEIHDRFGENAVFCGSFALKYYGMLDRIVKDLDVITKQCMYGTEDAVDLLFRDSSGRFYIGKHEVFCVHGGTKSGISVDYFWYNTWIDKSKVNMVPFHGVTIPLQSLEQTIQAKREYVNSGHHNISKHEHDLIIIDKRLQELNESGK